MSSIRSRFIAVAPDHPDYLEARFAALREAEVDAQMAAGTGLCMLNFPTFKDLRIYLQENGNGYEVARDGKSTYGINARDFGRSEIAFLQNTIKK